MNDNFKPYGFSRNFDYIKANFVILWKRTIEYKTQFYFAFFEQIFYLVTEIFFVYLLIQNFSDVVSWTFGDYFLFIILIDTIRAFAGTFIWGSSLSEEIISGNLNQYLFKPLNPFLQMIFNKLDSAAFFYILFNIIFTPIIIYFFKIQIINILLGFIIAILIGIFTVIIYNFLYSFSFKFLKLDSILVEIYNSNNNIVNSYPEPFMRKAFFKDFLYIFNMFFISSLLVPILRNHNINNISFQILILIGLIIFFSLGIYVNWKIGLKKYEAFG